MIETLTAIKEGLRFFVIISALLLASANQAAAFFLKDVEAEYNNIKPRNYIRIAGSSTVYPFVRTIAEEFGRNSEFRTPIVEATGTGGGMKLFCSGIGKKFIDFANASRPITKSEIKNCQKNGISNIIEIILGYDGIVLANSNLEKNYNFTKRQIFLALAKKVPMNGELIDNPYEKWSDIDPKLPNKIIAVYGPPPTSGTRDAFVEIVMEKVCAKMPSFQKSYPNKKKRKKACHVVRSDGKFIEAGENDNLIIQKLRNDPNAFGIFGFSFLEQNAGLIKAAKINNIYPTFEKIADNSYKIARPLFVYFKQEHTTVAKGAKEFINELTSPNAIGKEGYLVYKGMIPMPDKKIKKMREEILGGL